MDSGKYKNKYRIASIRLPHWDYRSNASYFITICTANRKHFFGKIRNGKMELSEIGILADKYWLEIPEHYPFIILDAHIIMPNHMHGIITISKEELQTPNLGVSTTNSVALTTPASRKWNPDSLGSIINQYKRICTIGARKINPKFAWQPRYYEHIIRNKTAYQNIKKYIINNPKNWQKDKFSG